MRRTGGLRLPCIPALALRLKAAAAQKAGLVCENPRDFVAQGIHATFEPVIEHIAQHAIEDPKSKWPDLPLNPPSGSAGPFYLVWLNPELSGSLQEEWP